MQSKNVEYEINIQSLILSQAQCPKEERACASYVPCDRERQSIPIQLQTGCRGKIVERRTRQTVRSEFRSFELTGYLTKSVSVSTKPIKKYATVTTM